MRVGNNASLPCRRLRDRRPATEEEVAIGNRRRDTRRSTDQNLSNPRESGAKPFVDPSRLQLQTFVRARRLSARKSGLNRVSEDRVRTVISTNTSRPTHDARIRIRPKLDMKLCS